MKLQEIKNIDISGKKVLIRCDFNVPMDEYSNISDDRRIRSALNTIRYCIDNDCSIILASHFGRPKEAFEERYSLKPIAKRLHTLLKQEIKMAKNCVQDDTLETAKNLEAGEILLLENLRYNKGETKNDEEFASKLASMADVYINDAFGVSHRAHSSVEGITKYFDKDSKAAGFLLAKEINFFHKIIRNTGPILCRDIKIVELLASNGIDSKFFGDLVLFDSDYTNRSQIPKKIRNIAFSVQHHPKYNEQAITLLSKLRALFDEQVKFFVTFHSEPNVVTSNFEKNTSNLHNVEYVNLCGEADKLDFYNNIDLHVGYRLHGHISFLRRKKPTILMAEDVRAYGFYKTNVLNYGIFDALDSEDPIDKATTFLIKQMDQNFEGYEAIFKDIDVLFNNVITSLK